MVVRVLRALFDRLRGREARLVVVALILLLPLADGGGEHDAVPATARATSMAASPAQIVRAHASEAAASPDAVATVPLFLLATVSICVVATMVVTRRSRPTREARETSAQAPPRVGE